MKKIIILLIILLMNTQSFADSNFKKDLKKVSKHNGFINKSDKIYSIDSISNKNDTIVIIYSHGSTYDQKIDKCKKKWNVVPSVIKNLDDKKINNFNVKIFKLCSGVRGWSQSEQDKIWKYHRKYKNLNLKDKNGNLLIDKQKQHLKFKILKEKIDNLKAKGFKNIVLAGHSSGGWVSIKIKTNYPNLVKGVIALHPGAGGTVKNRKEWPWWEDVRKHNLGDLSLLDAIIITHDKDNYNSPKDYSLFRNLDNVKIINISSSKCKEKFKLAGFHGLALTKCYAKEEKKNNNITKYLEEIF